MTEEERKNSNNEGPVRRRRTIGGNGEAEKPPIEEKNAINAPEAVENDSPKQRKRTLSADSAAQPKQSSTSSNRRTVKLGDSSVKQSDSANRRSQRPPREPKPKVGDTRRPAALSSEAVENDSSNEPKADRKRRRRGGRNRATANRRPDKPVEAILDDAPVTLDEAQLERRKGRERKGKPIGRYQMLVHVDEGVTHICLLYTSDAADE